MSVPSTSQLAAVLVADMHIEPDSAELAAGLILDAVQLGPDGVPVVSVRELANRHRASYPLWYRPTPTPAAPIMPDREATADVRAAEGAPDPWAHMPVTIQLLRSVNPAAAAKLTVKAGS